MADLLLYLTNTSVTLGQTMESEKSSSVVKDFESVELGDTVKKQKVPRRTIYFASGETMEEFSTDEEEEEEEEQRKQTVLSSIDPSKLTWGPYFWFHMWRVATNTISVCDYLGEKMASLLGITTPKYQYAIDEYYRMKKEEEEADEEDRLSEEAQRRFDNQQRDKDQTLTVEQPEGTSSFINMSFEVEQEPPPSSPPSSSPPPPPPSSSS